MKKTATVYLASEKDRCIARLRPVDGADEIFLCAANLDVCNNHPHVRELLIELAGEIAITGRRR